MNKFKNITSKKFLEVYESQSEDWKKKHMIIYNNIKKHGKDYDKYFNIKTNKLYMTETVKAYQTSEGLIIPLQQAEKETYKADKLKEESNLEWVDRETKL